MWGTTKWKFMCLEIALQQPLLFIAWRWERTWHWRQAVCCQTFLCWWWIKDLKDLDLRFDDLPLQRSVGVLWNLETDSVPFQKSNKERPYTRRGVLATVNSLYDHLGFVTPVTMQEKALLCERSAEQNDWDEPLPSVKQEEWNRWKESLKDLQHLLIARCYTPFSQSITQRRELCIFSDASTMATGPVAYLKTIDIESQWYIGFIMGKSKLAPWPAHTVPRLELCTAVLAVEQYELARDEMDINVDAVATNSKTVLGYKHNRSRRFYTCCQPSDSHLKIYTSRAVALHLYSEQPGRSCNQNCPCFTS